jgi:triacylglycerol lipase
MTFCGVLQLIFGGSLHAGITEIPAQSAPGEIRRVVLVHGIYNSARSMRRIGRQLEARGWQVYAISLKPNDASVPFDVMARQLDAFVTASIPAGEKFDLVAFSMGGLVSRYYIQKMGGYRRVRRFVTLSTPNHGTLMAWLSGYPGVKQMRPNSEMLRDLNADLSKLAPLDYTSIYTPYDLSIIPAASSRMPVGRNIICRVPLHPLMVMFPAPLQAVERALE